MFSAASEFFIAGAGLGIWLSEEFCCKIASSGLLGTSAKGTISSGLVVFISC